MKIGINHILWECLIGEGLRRMMFRLGFSLVVFISSHSALRADASEIVDIPDPYLLNAIRLRLDIPISPITLSDMERLETLYIRGPEHGYITDLSGLEYAENLQSLYLYKHHISNISAISGLSNLKTVSIDQCRIRNVPRLTELTELEDLSFEGNRIVDISFLSGLTQLKRLGLTGNYISNLTALSGLVQLAELRLSQNAISDTSPLVGLSSLTTLRLSGNSISDLTPLGELGGLQSLNLSGNEISDLSPLSGLDRLLTLQLERNNLTSLTSLGELGNLRKIYLDENDIADVAGLSKLSSLTHVEFSDNRIVDLSPLSGMTSLLSIWVNDNQITELDALANLANLESLAINNNPFDDIEPLAKLSQLSSLFIEGNSVSDLSPLAALENLEYLRIYSDAIVDISPLVDLHKLTVLGIGGNQLNGFSELASLSNLLGLRVSGENIISIAPIAQMPNLTSFELFDTSVSDLSPLSELSNITDIWLENNKIVDISVLATLSNIRDAYLPHNEIVDISPLSGMTGVRFIGLLGNNIGDIPILADDTDISGLDLRENPIADISPITRLASLESIGLSGLNNSDLEYMQQLPRLIDVYFNDGNISDLSALGALPNLRRIDLQGNMITDISPLVGLQNIEYLLLQNNSMDVSSRSNARRDIDRIIAKGTRVNFEPQRPVVQGTAVAWMSGDGPLSVPLEMRATYGVAYQWYIGESGDTSNPIEGATGPKLLVHNHDAADQYWGRVTNEEGYTSDINTVAVYVFPIFVNGGRIDHARSDASGDIFFRAIPDSGYRFVEWTGDVSGTDDEIPVDLYPHKIIAALFELLPPVIVSVPPDAHRIELGEAFELTVDVEGVGLSYQWYRSGEAINGKNSSKLSINSVTKADEGNYYVKISNTAGAIESGSYSLEVFTPSVEPDAPVIVSEPTGRFRMPVGAAVDFQILSEGVDLTYQWFFLDEPIAGETRQRISIRDVSLDSEGTYYVEVSNAGGTIKSTGFFVDVFEVGDPPLALENSQSFGAGYFESEWFGPFFQSEDSIETFVYSLDLGWTWISPDGVASSTWFWSYSMDSWLWGGNETGRFFFREVDQTWIYIVSFEDGGSFIYSNADDSWGFMPL
ncbi:leucine-rich repeat domain-containing protein [Rubellicoccus peritrichatus]|uniref:Leucine-rich repeat domain-containing protein n=1 Tax=Rubellicoccus peritrichatus TaxID=3080537 RepID=A0AAQ3LDB8_9BACT|nr:leucine-rich repeat domain-containing protein [Puniceicoccus sp. CR14]WOO43640.1 leucine-rich repeat domain-containing protein [Puniceicoccus sp. CR14]